MLLAGLARSSPFAAIGAGRSGFAPGASAAQGCGGLTAGDCLGDCVLVKVAQAAWGVALDVDAVAISFNALAGIFAFRTHQ